MRYWRRPAQPTVHRRRRHIGDVTIPAGSVVLLLPISANHDDAVFSAPATFDIDRPNASKHSASARD